MAYARRRTGNRSSFGRRTGVRTRRSGAARSPRRAAGRRSVSRGRSSGQQTVRIVLEGIPASPVSRPGLAQVASKTRTAKY